MTIFTPPYMPVRQPWCTGEAWRQCGGVPGVGVYGWVAGRAIPGTHPDLIPGSIFSIFKAKGPAHGQMKAILEVSQYNLQIDLRLTLRLTLELTQNDPPRPLPRLVPRWPSQTPYPDLRHLMVQNRAYLRFY